MTVLKYKDPADSTWKTLPAMAGPAGTPGTPGSTGATGPQGPTGSLPDQSINTQTANYVLALTDKNNAVGMNVASANTITVPPNSSVVFPIGSRVDIYQYGAGATTITPGSGVTIRTATGLSIAARYGGATLLKIATDEWIAFGSLI